LRCLRCDHYLVFKVELVANDDDRCVSVLHLVNRLNPVAHGLERLVARLVKRYDDAVSLPVELVGDVAELLLPRSVPNAHLDTLLILLIHILRLDELHRDCFQMIRLKIALIDSTK